MTTIKQGDIVRSNGRIKTEQNGSRRYIEFEAALVLETEPNSITVNPVGKSAVLLCQPGDLQLAKAAVKQAPTVELAGHVAESTATVTKPAPTLKNLKHSPLTSTESESSSAPKPRPTAKKPPARRRKSR